MVFIVGCVAVWVTCVALSYLVCEALGLTYGLPGALLAFPVALLASDNLARHVRRAVKQF